MGRILRLFVQHGADESILYDSHPHIGSDRLPGIIENIRRTITASGGEVRFSSRVTGLIRSGDEVKGACLESGEEIVYSDGSLYNAMRGSMAIPIVFTPGRTEDGRYVVDGGMVNNMPSDIARAMGADIVLAVDLNDVQREHNEGQLYYDIDTLTGVAFQVLDLVTSPNTVERYPLSDYVIIPDIAEIGVLDFYKVDEIFEIGKKTVEDNIEVFDQIEQALKGRKKERPLSYSERPYFVIESIITPPSFNHYRYLLSPLSGEVADYETIMRLEEILIYIKQEEGFKSIGYTVDDGKIIVKAEPFFVNAKTNIHNMLFKVIYENAFMLLIL